MLKPFLARRVYAYRVDHSDHFTGVLSVTTLPRFVDFLDDAYAASVQGTATAFKSSVKLAHLKWAVGGNTGPVDNLDLYGNGQNQIDINTNGWPAQKYLPYEVNPTLDNARDYTSV